MPKHEMLFPLSHTLPCKAKTFIKNLIKVQAPWNDATVMCLLSSSPANNEQNWNYSLWIPGITWPPWLLHQRRGSNGWSVLERRLSLQDAKMSVSEKNLRTGWKRCVSTSLKSRFVVCKGPIRGFQRFKTTILYTYRNPSCLPCTRLTSVAFGTVA